MAGIELQLEGHVAAARVALADVRANPRDTLARRRLYRHLGLAMDIAAAAIEANMTLGAESHLALVDLLDEVRTYSFHAVR